MACIECLEDTHDLDNLKAVFKNTLDEMRNLATFTSPFNIKKSKILKRLIDKANRIYQLGLLTTFQLPQQVLLYDKLIPYSGSDPSKYLCFVNSSSPREWWFYYGVCVDPTGNPIYPKFTLCFVRVGISRDVSIYNLFLGYSSVPNTSGDTSWYTPLSSYGYIDQQSSICNVTSTPISTMHYCGCDYKGNVHELKIVTESNKITGKYWAPDNIGGSGGMSFVLMITSDPKDKTTQGMPMYNGEGGCDPICFDGVGSLYWSYPNIIFAKYGDTPTTPLDNCTNGWAWFDHQLLSSGTPHSGLGRIIMGLTEKGYVPTRWLWTTAKMSENLQYQYHTTITKYPVHKDEIYDCSLNRYTHDKITYFISGKTKINKVLEITPGDDSFGYTFCIPVEYTITYTDDDKDHSYVFKLLDGDISYSGGGWVYTAGGTINWESAGKWMDANDTNTTGPAFLEANNFHYAKDAININISAGQNSEWKLSDDDKKNLESGNPVDKGRVYFLVIFIILLLAFLTVQIVCLYKKTHTKRNTESKWCCF